MIILPQDIEEYKRKRAKRLAAAELRAIKEQEDEWIEERLAEKKELIDEFLEAEAKKSRQPLTKRQQQARTQTRTRELISKGVIERTPCVICGDSPSQAHHPDYGDPTSVVFLCRYHHTMLHYYKQIREQGEPSSITRNTLKKYHEEYIKNHPY